VRAQRFGIACWLALLLVLLCMPRTPRAGDGEPTAIVGSTDELFELLRSNGEPEDEGQSIDEALAAHLRGGEVDEGTYPPSDLWEQQFRAERSEEPAEFEYGGRLFGRYSKERISGVTKWEKELELNLRQGSWDSYLRFSDVNNLVNINDPMRWEKFRLRYAKDEWKVTAGSFGAVFGRGLALNMYEERFLDFDNEADGLKVEYSSGNTEATVLNGTRKLRSEFTASTIKAARVHTRFNEHLEGGLSVVSTKFPDAFATAAEPNMHDYDIIEGDLGVRLGQFSAYGELVRVQRGEQTWGAPYQKEGADGTGWYANASVTGNGYSLQGEYKYYRHIMTPFMVPPTVRHWAEKNQSNPDDDQGYNFQLNLTPGKNAGAWQFSYGQDNTQNSETKPYTELLASYTSPSKRGFSYVAEYNRILEEIFRYRIVKLTLNQQLDDDWTSSGFIQLKHQDADFGSGFGYLMYDVELAYQSLGNIIYTREVSNQETADPNLWELWELAYRPNDRQELHIMHGSRRAGFVCSGGICRLEPEFNGTKIDYLVRF
jgi:hypothetical protein